ncbi:MAG: hypothetical protein QOG77_872, partial [Solirubrobacteraceae bacterium]|nr:hypothetical protein [Solirubrobacteraceae bacterium]
MRILLAGVVAVLVATTAWLGGALEPIEHAAVDARFALRDTSPADDIVVVGIDERSIAELGAWPFRRSRHAQAVDRLRQAGARSIVLDMQFTEPSPHPQDDLALYDAIDRAGGATLATTISDADGKTNVLGGDENLARIDSRAAASDFPATWGGVIRRYPQRIGKLPSIAVVAASRVTGRSLGKADFHEGGTWIDFRGGPGTFSAYSFADLVKGRVPRSALAGKIVVVGATAPSLQDRHVTATSGGDTMSGPEVQANAIWTAMHGNPLRDAPPWVAALTVVLLGMAVPLLSLVLRPILALGAAAALAALAAVVAQAAFERGVVVAVAAPLLSLLLGTFTSLVAGYAFEARRRRRAAAY